MDSVDLIINWFFLIINWLTMEQMEDCELLLGFLQRSWLVAHALPPPHRCLLHYIRLKLSLQAAPATTSPP